MGDPYWNSVVLLAHFDNDSIDMKGHTPAGAYTLSAAQSVFGGGSLSLNGTNQSLTFSSTGTDLLLTGPFCIEAFVWTTAYATAVLMAANESSYGWWIYLPYNASTAWSFNFVDTSGAPKTLTGNAGALLQLNTWYHLAVSWDGTKYRMFQNGKLVGTLTSDSAIQFAAATTSSVIIGARNATARLSGYVDEVRITNGVARYTGNFTVPAQAFPESPPQLSGTIVDAQGNPVSRPVAAYKRSTMALASAGVSDETTGAFQLAAYDDTPHMVVALPVKGDPFWDKVVLLMHMDSTPLVEAKGRSAFRNGGVRSSTQSKVGGYSAYFSGSYDYLSFSPHSDFNFKAGDFTIEFYVYFSTVADALLIGFSNVFNAPVAVQCYSGQLRFYCLNSALVFKTGVMANTWYHVAIARKGVVFRCFCDGVLTASRLDYRAVGDSSGAIDIGGFYSAAGNLNGYIDELRITKGIARYTTDFTPALAPFPHAITEGTENALILDNILPI